MSSQGQAKAFRIVVSDKKSNKLGQGGTAQQTARSIYYYAEGDQEGSVFLQALNSAHVPSGKKRTITLEEFMDSFRPEPLFYYNKVKPAIEGVEAEIEKGESHLEAGRPDQASKCFSRVLAVDEENIRGVFGLGMAYMAAGKLDDAEAILGRIMELEMAFAPEHIHLFNRFGIQMRKAGMLRQALDYYAKAATLNGDDEHLHFNTCRIHYELEDMESAYGCVNRALVLNGEFGEALRMRAHLVKIRPELESAPADAGQAPAIQRDYEGLDLDDVPWED